MFEHLIGPLSPRMVPVQDPDYHHEKTRALAEVSAATGYACDCSYPFAISMAYAPPPPPPPPPQSTRL